MKGPKGKFAWTATVGERGQIVIPKQARELFGIKPGDTLLLLGDSCVGGRTRAGGMSYRAALAVGLGRVSKPALLPSRRHSALAAQSPGFTRI